MPLSTDLSQTPYFDDYADSKNFHKVLFQPGVSVQIRELNQLQSILQKQIERFGDNIFRRGTIIDGCNFIFYPSYPYAKIKDTETDGTNSLPGNYNGNLVEGETSGLKATIVNYKDGFEASDPDLKTLYFKFINSGTNSNTFVYSAGETLKVYDRYNSVHEITVDNGGLGFSNADTLVVTSAIAVNVSSGSFSNGEYIYNSTGANLQIVGIDSTTLASANQVILKLKPRDADLANGSANSLAWTVANNDSITNAGNTATGVIESKIGSGLDGSIITNGSGRVTSITVSERGTLYTTPPTVRIKSANNSSGLSSLSLTAQNYLGRVKVASVSDAVGNGYAFGIGEGVVYQKGFFVRVDPQVIVVEKYSQTPNAVSVVFETNEEIVTADIDDSLVDNASGEPNETAPGADRLKLVPTLKLVDANTADESSEYMTLVQWSEGVPFKQNQYTQYNKINDEMARRTSDSSGNFVIDQFMTTTRSPANSSLEGSKVSVVVDPGTAYINGHRIKTFGNYYVDVNKGTDTTIANNQTVSLNYENYVIVDEVGGVFQFSTGDTVKLYDTAKDFVSNTALVYAGTVSSAGTQIGTARVRSVIRHDSNAANPKYRLYLFDISINSGKNFRDVRSIYYDGTNKGIADVYLELDGTTNTSIAVLHGPGRQNIIFDTGVNTIKNANNVTYNYRTIDQSAATSNNGTLTKDISSSTDEFFPYSGTLTSAQLQEIAVVPIGGHMIANVALTGSASVNTTSANIVGTSTTWLTDLAAGDYIYLNPNATANDIHRVSQVVNNTLIVMDAAATFANTSTTVTRCFPKHVIAPFGVRSGLSGNVNANGNILTLDFGMRFAFSGTTNTAISVNIQRQNATQSTKTPQRNKFVKLCLSNNAGLTDGPWCVGVPDAFRLRNVYVGNSTVNSSSNNLTNAFYIDHNQNPNFYDLSYLYVKPRSNPGLTSSDYLLVELDHFTTSGSGYYDTVSYIGSNSAATYINDSTPLANLSSTINTFEIPEIYTTNGKTIDPLTCFDFRPYAVNTVALGSNASTAPLNPNSAISFGNTADPANDQKFPVPDSSMTAKIERYIGRTESVFVGKDSRIFTISGNADADPNKQYPPNDPEDAIKIADIIVPSYPNLPITTSAQMGVILNTRIANEKYLRSRIARKTVTRVKTIRGDTQNQPRGYSMAEIGKMDRRLKDVEYYVSLSLLETNLKDKIIPSSSDPSINRFKFGFAVDDFSTYKFLDDSNPQFAAYVEDNCLVPEKMSWMLPLEVFLGNPDYIDQTIVSQVNATVPLNFTGEECTPTANIANALAFGISSGGATSNVATTQITMAVGNSASATLFFYNYDNFTKVEIYQGNTLIKSTADSVVLTATDKAFVTSANAYAWFDDSTATYMLDRTLNGSNYAKYAGKITWTHNPSNGREYTILIRDASNRYRWIAQYPIDSQTVGCDNPAVTPPPTVAPGVVAVEIGGSGGIGSVDICDPGVFGDMGAVMGCGGCSEGADFGGADGGE